MVFIRFTFMVCLLLFAFFVHAGIAVHTAHVITCYSSLYAALRLTLFNKLFSIHSSRPSVLSPLVSNSHLPQGLINVAKRENHNLLISCKEVRKCQLYLNALVE